MSKWFSRLFGSAAAAEAGVPPRASEAASSPSLDLDVAFLRWVLAVEIHSERGLDDNERELLRSVRDTLADERLASRVPRVPAIVPQLLQMLRDPARSASDLAQHIAHDAVLVASVLRGANSPYYGAGRRIDGLDQAVLVLGQDGLRQLVAAVALKPLINVQSGRFTRTGAPRVWQQSELAGSACRVLAPGTPLAFEAFLGVLSLNMGTILVLRVFDEHAPTGPTPGSQPFCKACNAAIRELAAQIGAQWGFPASVTAAVASDADSPQASLMQRCETASRLRVLVDASELAVEDAAMLVGNDSALAACIAALGRQAGDARC